jgi:hypothetical protein
LRPFFGGMYGWVFCAKSWQLLYAQVVKTVRRRRLVRVTHRVVFGTLAAVEQVLAPLGWQINTAFVEVRPVGRKEVPASG